MNKWMVVLFLFLCYLYIGTGIHSDDYIFLNILGDKSFFEIIYMIFTSPLYLKNSIVMLFDFTQFYFFDYNSIYYDIVKVFTSFFIFYVVYIFSRDYLSTHNSFLFAFMFILFPIHDATNYWVVGQYLFLTLAFIMLSHYFINNDKYYKGFFLGLIGVFSSYASLPFSFGLSIVFLVKKQYTKFILFVIPQFIYIIYYFSVSRFFNLQSIKGTADFSILSLVKQYILQFGTFVDASFGPSFWLKLYYSIIQISVMSILIGLILISLFYKYYSPKREFNAKPLIFSFIMITLCAFGIFALTGMYPQVAFNLGNRVTIYGSLLVSLFIIIFLMNNKKYATILFSVFIFSILGISDHWKSWNKSQLQIIDNISKNKEIRRFDRREQLFVSHNQYSKFGDLTHIEFFAQGMASHIFKLAIQKDYKVSTLNRRFIYADDFILDKKYNKKIHVNETVYVYDSKDDKLLKIKKENIKEYIQTLPKDNRHWINLLDKDNFMMRIVLTLMPRLEYANN